MGKNKCHCKKCNKKQIKKSMENTSSSIYIEKGISPNGTICAYSSECQSGWCQGTNGDEVDGGSWGRCTSTLIDGSLCPMNNDNQCTSKKCGYTVNNSGNEYRICCSNGYEKYAGGYYWCSGLGPGATCKHDVQCANGKCNYDSSKGYSVCN